MVYATACGQNAEALMDMVNEYLEEGYVPQGGPIMVGRSMMQAVVKTLSDAELREFRESKAKRRNATNRNDS